MNGILMIDFSIVACDFLKLDWCKMLNSYMNFTFNILSFLIMNDCCISVETLDWSDYNDRPLYIHSMPPAETVCSLKTRPQHYWDHVMQQNWNLGLGYAFPPFCLSQVLAKLIMQGFDNWHTVRVFIWHCILILFLSK